MPDITYGEATTLTARIRRITAPNSGMMTGPGTNSYIVGSEELALIDPGPAIDAHIDAIVELFGARLRWILVTHTHGDHSPAAKPIAQATGAQLIGNTIDNDGHQDPTFSSDRVLAQDDCLQTGEFTIRAFLSPGHVSNHICYLVEEDRVLMTGDHIMQGSTVVIIPPAGNMKDYIESLERMLNYNVDYLAPGHGHLIERPHDEVRHLIEHRMMRERKVVTALQRIGPSDIESLTPVVYDDVDESRHRYAAMSLHAHLLKLQVEQRATLDGKRWALCD